MSRPDPATALSAVTRVQQASRAELATGSRPWWFFPTVGVAVGACVTAAGLPADASVALASAGLALVALLAWLETRMVRMWPHAGQLWWHTLAVVLVFLAILAGVAVCTRWLLLPFGAIPAAVGNGVCVAVTVTALARPSLHALAATLRGRSRP